MFSSSPGVVVANTHSVGASLAVWLASGLLAWTGASSYAELGSSIPVNGGAQAYLQYSYGPLVSYLFAWTAISVLKPGAFRFATGTKVRDVQCYAIGGNAVISLIFAEYLNRLFYHSTKSDISPDALPQWAIKLTAVIAVILISMICVATPTFGPRTAVFFTFLKVCTSFAMPH